jgi:hypothetical protein
MDEGINTFVQYVAEQDFGDKYPDAIAPNKKYPSRRGPAKKYCKLYVRRSKFDCSNYDKRIKHL